MPFIIEQPWSSATSGDLPRRPSRARACAVGALIRVVKLVDFRPGEHQAIPQLPDVGLGKPAAGDLTFDVGPRLEWRLFVHFGIPQTPVWERCLEFAGLESRDADAAAAFIGDLAGRMASRIQLTSDGNAPYLQAVEDAFGAGVDYAMLVKIYGSSPEAQKRYSPAECVGCRKQRVTGNPHEKHISTSFVERQNRR